MADFLMAQERVGPIRFSVERGGNTAYFFDREFDADESVGWRRFNLYLRLELETKRVRLGQVDDVLAENLPPGEYVIELGSLRGSWTVHEGPELVDARRSSLAEVLRSFSVAVIADGRLDDELMALSKVGA